MISDAAAANGISSSLLSALVDTESSFNPNAKSGAGAMGLTQLMPGTARGLGVSNPLDPAQNLNGGAKYLRQMINQFGDIKAALAAYNAGPGNVQKAKQRADSDRYEDYAKYLPQETQKYVPRVMSKMGG